MKNLLLFISFLVYVSSNAVEQSKSQVASRILGAFIPRVDSTPRNLVMVDSANNGNFRTISIKNIPIAASQIIGWADSMNSYVKINDTVPSGTFMTKSAANSAISGMESQIATKQSQLSGTGFVKSSGSTISYDNTTYLTSEVDGSATNEIQIISGTGNQINLSNGGSYTIPAQSWSSITSRPTFSTVATTGDYNDLTNKPTIPSFTRGTGTISSNAVTINATRGQITYNSPSLIAAGTVSITFTNSNISNTSNIQFTLNGLNNDLAGTVSVYIKSQTTGSCVFNIRNLNLLSVFNPASFAIDFTVQN